MKSAEIRQAFLDYFEGHGHTVVPSSSLVPGNDPTLLFTNAGMVQFKECFLGLEQRDYVRAASSQRCVRAGGKHNDLENVGYTARHHTFFEMLGNFSFGDYFKHDAIRFAWEFLTGVLGLPPERLWVTVHVSDDEAAAIWIDEIGVDPARFSRLDEDNFWQMGDTGPCGPSSEIFYDHGPDVAGGPPGSPDDDGDRYIEVWNLVFMQYERQASGELEPLPNPSIDTGMGLERISAVMQGVHNNYDIDLFRGLLRDAAQLTGTSDTAHQSLRVIADHIRSCAFLIVDGVLPSNEGRGYVLRRIIRRALRHGHKLGVREPFFHRLVDALEREMGAAYPELSKARQRVEKVLLAEEEQFARTLENGLQVLNEAMAKAGGGELSGDVVFQLYDTYGFPVDLTADIARERGLALDMDGYEKCMQQQRERARAASRFGVDYTAAVHLEGETHFVGYEATHAESPLKGIFRDGAAVGQLDEGEEAILVLEQTPFYAESGGQVGDCGIISTDGARFEVSDCRKQGAHHLHIGRLVQGELRADEIVTAQVDSAIRQRTANNHSATHLLHAALRSVLGEHVAQQGSLVDSRRLRFDFSHPQPVADEEIRAIEALVNREIRRNSAVDVEVMAMDEARERGAIALFGEKYGDRVRVLSMGDGFSVELCGGTHVQRTGDIGLLKIVSESGIAAGVRRIEAITGEAALDYYTELEGQFDSICVQLRSDREQLPARVEQLVAQVRQQTREIDDLRRKLASGAGGGDLAAQAVALGDARYLGAKVEGADGRTLRDLVDQMKSRLGSCVVLLLAETGDKVAMVCGVSKDLVARIDANAVLAEVGPVLGGKGGGRPDLAQGGGAQPEQIDAALSRALEFVQSRLAD